MDGWMDGWMEKDNDKNKKEKYIARDLVCVE
jgi:hypothetical protein